MNEENKCVDGMKGIKGCAAVIVEMLCKMNEIIERQQIHVRDGLIMQKNECMHVSSKVNSE